MKFKIAQFQTHVFEEKEKNINQLAKLMEATLDYQPENEAKIDMISVGEMFTSPYETARFPEYAEPEGGESWQACSDLAKKHRVYLVAGSIPEKDDAGNVYNTAYVFDRDGSQIAKHRKVHLFDIDVEGGQYFKESDTLTAGDQCTVFDTEFGKMGICICFDIRFPELCMKMVLEGAKVIFVPASFNMTTGPAHWRNTFIQRAVDNQCYMVGTSDARDPDFSYVAWGHSIVTDPWGKVISELDDQPGCAVSEIDLDYVDKIRRELPLLSARKTEVY